MLHGPLYQDGYRPQFSGHETFPLRYGWLKKVFDRVAETESEVNNRVACWGDDAIARFGVGKNMVASMRHWAKATGIIVEPAANAVRTTEFGSLLFGAAGIDPYMEYPATLWLLHWQLAAHAEKTTWFWAFSHCAATAFEREALIRSLCRFAADRNWSRAAGTTIRADVACFIRTYTSRQASGRLGHDDALESPLTELGLIRSMGQKDSFRFARGPKTTLGNGVFAYALNDFWSRYIPNAATLSLEVIAHAPGGPGRVFLFDEDDTAERMSKLEDVTGGALRWSETAGLQQVIRSVDVDWETARSWIDGDCSRLGRKTPA